MKRAFTFIVMLLAFACYAEAQIIGATDRRSTNNPTGTNSPDYRPTGPSLRISTGFPNIGLLAFNYQVTPYFLVGAGSGININGDADLAVPIYGELELRTPRNKWSLFCNVKIGYAAVADYEFFSTMIGFGYKNLSVGLGISTTYDYYYDYFYNYHDYEPFIIPMISLSYNLPLKNLSKVFF